MSSSDSLIRLNKYLALHLGVSRREADDMIANGRVVVNGKPAQLGQQITAADNISVDGAKANEHVEYTYLAFHKPRGYVCSRKQQGSTPTIYSLLPSKYHHLKPVGRLDADSSGLILLTNDGDFAHRMTHPKFAKQKIYLVTLDRELEPLHQQMINDFGVQLDDGPSKLTLERQHDDSRTQWIVRMSEGRNRQIRRTFNALGYNVIKLHRTQFGDYRLDSLKRSNFQEIVLA